MMNYSDLKESRPEHPGLPAGTPLEHPGTPPGVPTPSQVRLYGISPETYLAGEHPPSGLRRALLLRGRRMKEREDRAGGCSRTEGVPIESTYSLAWYGVGTVGMFLGVFQGCSYG